MLTKIGGALQLLLVAVSLAGCVNPRSFVDPTVPRPSYDEVARLTEPMRLGLTVEFQRNGAVFPRVQSTLRDITALTLRGTGVIIPVEEGQEGNISVTVNNIGDVAAARIQGFGSGLTYGLVGTTVTDGYEMTVVINARGRQAQRSGIRHAIHTAIGSTSVPAGLEATTTTIAFQRVVEAMLLRVIVDMQRSGELPQGPIPGRPMADLPVATDLDRPQNI
jgi:hypothetical protein